MIKLHRLQLQNFKQLGSVAVHFPDKGSTLIEGHNEAGKSSLFEAVFFALYGDSLTGMKHTELKRYNSDEMRVALEFSIEGRRFSVERTVRGNQKVRLLCPSEDGTPQEIKNATECKKHLERELGISASALLNTCFVEQKRLDKLESISKNDRKETVNELLNMDVLNILEKQFRVTSEDKELIQTAKRRVEIAEIDALLPQLKQEVLDAARSLLCQESQEFVRQRGELERQVGAAQQQQKEIAQQITAIETVLAQGATYEKQLKVIRDVLPLQIAAWQNAETQHQTTVNQVAEWEHLEQELPARREEYEQCCDYHSILKKREALQAEAHTLEAERQTLQKELTEYDALQAAWGADEIEREQCETTRTAAQSERDAAQAAYDTRLECIQRGTRLVLLRQHYRVGEEALKDAERLAAEQSDIRQQGEKLPEWRVRKEQYAEAQGLKQRQEALEQEQKTRAVERSAMETRLNDAAKLREEIESGESRLAGLNSKLEEQQREAEQARNQLIAVECRDALREWADAKERSLEAAPDLGQEENQRQQAAAKLQTQEAEERIATAKRRQIPGFALLGSGAIGIWAAFVTPFLIPLLALGVLLGVGGGLLLMKTRKALAESQALADSARKETEKLALRQELAAEQATKLFQQREKRMEEETAKCAVLERLNLLVPESPTEARQQAAAYPQDSSDLVRQTETHIKNALTQTRAEYDALEESLRKERKRLAEFDFPALNEALARIEAKENNSIAEQEKIAVSLDHFLNQWNLPNTDTLVQKIAQLDKQITQLEAAQRRLPELEQQEQDKRTTAKQERDKAGQIAQELGLGGTVPQEWEQAAVEEQEAFRAECEQTSDTFLQMQAEMTASRLRMAEQQLNEIVGRQKERRNRLDAQDRSQMAAKFDAVRDKQTDNQAAQQKYAPILEQLEARSLPQTAAELNTHLTVMQNAIEADTAQVAALPEKRKAVHSCADAVADTSAQFAKTWSETLPGNPVPSLSEADAQCDKHANVIASRLQSLNIPARKIEKEALNEQRIELGNDIARHQQSIGTLSAEITERYGKLNLDEANADTQIQNDPVLRVAHHRSVDEWRTELRAREDTLTAKQTERKTQADNLDLPPNPLELDAERQALANAQRERDIKECATRIIAETRRNIVSRVMPLTLANVRFLLPALTAGRYKDLEWDENDNTLHIFDERAGQHKTKNVFSGGAKDQISLALRLGFALATLPTGKTSRPNWLFLDEPLSSFDRERTLALVDLLTKGILRQKFDQIFLISHSEAFDPSLFDFHLKMENGTVAHSTLPAPA